MATYIVGDIQGCYDALQRLLEKIRFDRALSPIEGIRPENLRVRELIIRVRAGGVKEVILATNPSMEGDYTAAFLRQQLLPLGVHLTRLARGLPVGGDLEYADQNTLLRALSGRQEMD